MIVSQGPMVTQGPMDIAGKIAMCVNALNLDIPIEMKYEFRPTPMSGLVSESDWSMISVIPCMCRLNEKNENVLLVKYVVDGQWFQAEFPTAGYQYQGIEIRRTITAPILTTAPKQHRTELGQVHSGDQGVLDVFEDVGRKSAAMVSPIPFAEGAFVEITIEDRQKTTRSAQGTVIQGGIKCSNGEVLQFPLPIGWSITGMKTIEKNLIDLNKGDNIEKSVDLISKYIFANGGDKENRLQGMLTRIQNTYDVKVSGYSRKTLLYDTLATWLRSCANKTSPPSDEDIKFGQTLLDNLRIHQGSLSSGIPEFKIRSTMQRTGKSQDAVDVAISKMELQQMPKNGRQRYFRREPPQQQQQQNAFRSNRFNRYNRNNGNVNTTGSNSNSNPAKKE